jgi:hypothetical protein
MRWGLAGSTAILAVALMRPAAVQAQASWWSSLDVGAASTLSSGMLPSVAAGLNLGGSVVENGRFRLQANLSITAPLAFAGDVVCISATECTMQHGASQVGTLTGDLGYRPGGTLGRMTLFASLGAYRANPWHHDSRTGNFSQPTSDVVTGGGIEWRFGSFALALRYLNYADVYARRAEALGASLSHQFRLN